MGSDHEYFLDRAKQERAAAAAAACPLASKAHLELAFRFEDLASAIYANERSADRKR